MEKTSWVHGAESHMIVKSDKGKDQYNRDMKIYNNAAQVWNHNFYWKCLSPSDERNPSGKLLSKINEDLGNLDNFKQVFLSKSLEHFGSGWIWVTVEDGKIRIETYDNAITPVSFEYPGQKTILLCLDLWEHAWYIDFGSSKKSFVKAFLDRLINWKFVEQRFEAHQAS